MAVLHKRMQHTHLHYIDRFSWMIHDSIHSFHSLSGVWRSIDLCLQGPRCGESLIINKLINLYHACLEVSDLQGGLHADLEEAE
jgi:hypothetical protein